MSETSRYLLLERRLRPSTAPTGAPNNRPGAAEPLQPPQAVATSVRAFDDGRPIELRYDAGAICKVAEPAEPPSAATAPQEAAPPAPPVAAPAQSESPLPAQAESPPPAQAESPPRAQAESPPPAQAESPPPALARPEAAAVPAPEAAAPVGEAAIAELSTLENDDDFAAQLRSLVEAASAPSDSPRPEPQATPEAAPAPAPAAPEAPPAEDDRYGVFDRIGEALASPRTFDLGSVPVTAAFDAIEKSMDRNEGRRAAKAPAEPSPPPPLEHMDLIEDLSLMPAAEAASWVGYTPGRADALVIDSMELAAPAGVRLKNWSAPGVSQFVGKPNQRTRARSDVRQIVIHETVSPTWNGVHDPALGVQFHLDRDGTLVQHNDALDLLWHVRTFSEHSVGIEVVNLVFDKDASPNPGELEPGDRIPVAWGGQHGSHYVVPPAAQMEALALTIDALRGGLGIPDNWIQVRQHPDPAKAAAMPDRWFFVIGTNGHLYFKDMVDEPWVGSHSALRDHADGAFPTLYCYLRLHKAMTPENAYAMARQVAEDAGNHRRQTHFDAATGATLQMLDITDVA